MAAAHHTPGPWRTNIARRSDNGIVAAHVVTAEGGNIAQVAIYDEVPGLTETHTYLIAAAPEMLAVAKQAVGWLAFIADTTTEATNRQNAAALMVEAEAAIAKAEGRS